MIEPEHLALAKKQRRNIRMYIGTRCALFLVCIVLWTTIVIGTLTVDLMLGAQALCLLASALYLGGLKTFYEKELGELLEELEILKEEIDGSGDA